LYLDLVDGEFNDDISVHGKFNYGDFFSRKIPSKNEVNRKLMVLIKKGGVCVFDENLREVNVCFKTRGGVCHFSKP